MREGFTTGSCAAAAALASCIWQCEGECPQQVELIVPEGRKFVPAIRAHVAYTCGVIKDAGDDPDITNGCEVRARVEIHGECGDISFRAGAGVGVITQPGLKLPVGEAAINPVPREMITRAVRSAIGARAATVTISIPSGEQLAGNTFNPRLGIQGGLSILGTSGIVRPMSEEALAQSIALELSMRRAGGCTELGLVFGNQGEHMLAGLYPLLPIVQMSNFVGVSLDEAAKLGFTRLIIAGHPGKLAKVAAGAMQTHSRYGDSRREAIIAQLALMNAPCSLIQSVYGSLTTEAAITAIDSAGYRNVWNAMADAAQHYCAARVHNALAVDILFLDGQGAKLGVSQRMLADADIYSKYK